MIWRLGIFVIGSDFQVVILNILRCGGRDAKKDFEIMVKFGIGLRKDIQRDAVVPQVGISCRLESELKGIFLPIKAFIMKFSNFLAGIA